MRSLSMLYPIAEGNATSSPTTVVTNAPEIPGATAESIERRIRRIENDDELAATLRLHPLASRQLRLGKPPSLLLSIDPTTQDDRAVMVSVGVCYRARTLPLAWVVWPANQPLIGDGFWKRIEALLDIVADLLPIGVPVT